MFLKADCGIDGLENIFHYGVIAVNVIQIAVPIALIIWGSLDLLKGIIAGDEKKISAAKKPFIQRLITALIVFLVPWITYTVLNAFTKDANEGWQACYNAAKSDDAKKGMSAPSDPGEIGKKK